MLAAMDCAQESLRPTCDGEGRGLSIGNLGALPPHGVGPPPKDDVLGYLIHYYTMLRELIMDAAQADEVLLVYLN